MLTQKKNSFKALTSDPRYITTLQTTGNKKLLDTETIQNMRWNLPARTTCPYATPHCFNSCYAFRDERYTNVKQSRALSLDYANDRNFARNMIYSIESNLSRPCFKGKKVYFRIHESGDFYSLAYTKKWLQVIKHFEGNQNLVFVAYTKSIDYFIKLGLDSSDAIAEKYPNFVLSLSLWDDTPDDIKALAGRFKTYTALYPEEIQTRKREEKETFHHCKCSGCGSTCRACMTYRIKKYSGSNSLIGGRTMEYYNYYFLRYLKADSNLRNESKKHWIKCHRENIKSGREDMIIFSAKMLASIALADDVLGGCMIQ